MNVEGYTTCNAPLIFDHDKVREICNKYGGFGGEIDENFGPSQDREWRDGHEVFCNTSRLNIFGYDWFNLYPRYSEEEDGASGEFNFDADAAATVIQFLKEIQPFLLENLVVQSIDYEGLRFPFGGATWFVPKKRGKIVQAWGILISEINVYKKRFGDLNGRAKVQT